MLIQYGSPGKIEVKQNTPSSLKSEVYQADFDETFRLVIADLTSDGNQYSKTITAPAAQAPGTATVLYEAELTPKAVGTLLWAYFLVVVNLAQSAAVGDCYWKPQARNRGGTWADLAPWQTIAADASTPTDYRLEGDISWLGSPIATYEDITDNTLWTNLTSVPMDFRVLFYTDHATETTDGMLKNASQIRLVGKVT